MDRKHGLAAQLIRHIIQAAAFLLFPGLFITVFAAIRDLVAAGAAGTFSLPQLLPQIILTAGVLLTTALAGRFFCSYLCSFGMFQEVLYFFSKRRVAARVHIPERTDHTLKSLKYGVLAAIVVFIWVMQLPVESTWSPWGVFGVLVSGNYAAVPEVLPTLGFVLLLATAAGSLLIPHFFCRYFCPLGAIFAVTSRWRLYRVRRNPETCTHCGRCLKACSMGINIPAKDSVNSGECIQCMECLPSCPPGSLTANPSGAVIGMAAVAAIGGSVMLGDNVTLPVSSDAADTVITQDAFIPAREDDGRYKDGVYTGTGRGFRGTVSVEVTVENGEIADITVLSYGDDRQFFERAQSAVIGEILREQIPDVSTVSGATYSSYGIMDAVADALESGADSSISADDDMDAWQAEGPERRLPKMRHRPRRFLQQKTPDCLSAHRKRMLQKTSWRTDPVRLRWPMASMKVPAAASAALPGSR